MLNVRLQRVVHLNLDARKAWAALQGDPWFCGRLARACGRRAPAEGDGSDVAPVLRVQWRLARRRHVAMYLFPVHDGSEVILEYRRRGRWLATRPSRLLARRLQCFLLDVKGRLENEPLFATPGDESIDDGVHGEIVRQHELPVGTQAGENAERDQRRRIYLE